MGSQAGEHRRRRSIRSAYGRMRSALPVATLALRVLGVRGRQPLRGLFSDCSDKQSSSCEGPPRPPRTSKNDSNVGPFTIPLL